MPKYKSSSQEIWLSDDKYSPWLQKDKNTRLAKCKVCSKSFLVAAMGIKELDAHANAAKSVCRKRVLLFRSLRK